MTGSLSYCSPREAGSPATADLVAPEVTMATVVGTSEEVAEASQDTALVLPSSPTPASPSASLGTGAPRLDDDVLHQFDATHRLSELSTAWGNLVTFATSFGEKLLVSFSKVLSLAIHLSLVLTPCLSLSLSIFSVFFS